MDLSKINLREKDFHNKLQSKKKGRFENIFYKSIYNINEDFFLFLKQKVKGSDVLDYGCGIGTFVEKIINYKPNKVCGIDISEVSISKARTKAKDLKINVDFSVDNCEKTKFKNNSFDVVYGTGILHHLQFNKCLDEIHRILKPNGSIVFVEPLGTNPLINLYRRLTPSSRSKDEHPLLNEDFDYIKGKFVSTKIKYYGFLTLVFFPFYKDPIKSKIFKLLSRIDQILFKFNFFKLLAWSVLITADKD